MVGGNRKVHELRLKAKELDSRSDNDIQIDRQIDNQIDNQTETQTETPIDNQIDTETHNAESQTAQISDPSQENSPPRVQKSSKIAALSALLKENNVNKSIIISPQVSP